MQLMVTKMETFGGALEDIEAFSAVIELGSISAAARRLEESKGGISRRISRLERRLETALLTRTPRAVSPTEEGLAFYQKARDALALLTEAGEEARGARSLPRGHLRVTAPHDIGLNLLPALVVQFRAAYPLVTVELLLDDALLDLASNRIDLALRASSGDLPDSSYRASPLIAFSIGFYASADYLAKHPGPRTPGELAKHAVVVSREYVQGAARMRLLSAGGRQREEEVLLQPAFHASDYAGVQRLLMAGGGIGAIPDIDAAEEVSDGRLVRVLDDWHLGHARLYAISVQGRESPARVRAFMEFAKSYLQGLQ